MATLTASATTAEEGGGASPLQQARDKIISTGIWLIKVMLVAIILLAEFCSVPKFSDTRANVSDIRQEMDGLLRSGSTRELEFDLDSDMELYRTMMALVTNMKYGDFELEGSKAQEFWTAYAPAKSDAKLQYIRFRSDERRVLLRYSNGIASDITMEFDTNYFYKATTLNYGIFNGSLLRWLYWKVAGRFINGYPCYVTEALIGGNGVRGDVTLRKYTLRNQFFSWKFPPDKYRNAENITEHWTT